MKFYLVGGSVRDEILGQTSSDHDFVVEGAPSFEALVVFLKMQGFYIYQEKPEFLTVRARFPENPNSQLKGVADFVLCRKEGSYSDGRRPDVTEPATLLDDLARRDFTVNAMAKCTETGEIIDPWNGRDDLMNHRLKFVGDPIQRISEDGLRVLRAYRFIITKKLNPDVSTGRALIGDVAATMLGKVAVDRIREELTKMFAYSTEHSMVLLASLPENIYHQIFRDGLRLVPTQKAL